MGEAGAAEKVAEGGDPAAMLDELLKRENVKALQTFPGRGPILRMKGILQSYFMRDSEIYTSAIRARAKIQEDDDILSGKKPAPPKLTDEQVKDMLIKMAYEWAINQVKGKTSISGKGVTG